MTSSERCKEDCKKKKPKNTRNITMDDMTNHAYAIFDLFDVNRSGEISERDLKSCWGRWGCEIQNWKQAPLTGICNPEK